jgi:hypothetical protein
MKNRRKTYELNVTEAQMKELQLLVKQERQRIAVESSKRTPQVTRLQALQKALQRSIYFHNKHMNKDKHINEVNGSDFSEEDAWWEAIR